MTAPFIPPRTDRGDAYVWRACLGTLNWACWMPLEHPSSVLSAATALPAAPHFAAHCAFLRQRSTKHENVAGRRRLDLVIYGATPLGGALCCDATLVSPLTRSGQPQPCASASDGAALRVAERRKHPELSAGGPQRLVVLGAEVGGRWNDGAQRLLRDLVRLRAQRAPPALRRATVEW